MNISSLIAIEGVLWSTRKAGGQDVGKGRCFKCRKCQELWQQEMLPVGLLYIKGVHAQRLSNCGSGTSNITISTTQEFARNANFRPHPRPTRSETLGR